MQGYDYPPPPPRPWRGPRVFRFWRWIVYPAVGVLAVAGSLYGARLAGERVGDALNDDSVAAGTPVQVEIPPGADAQLIGEILEESGVVSSARGFGREVVDLGLATELKAGFYELSTGMELLTAIEELVAGPSVGENVYKVRIREGATVDDILTGLAAETTYSKAQFASALLNGDVSSSLLHGTGAKLRDWEGLLFPDTYQIAKDDTPEAILQRFASTMVSRVESIDWSGLEALGVSVYDAIVVASMIEREAALDEDRPKIASVIYNRLDIGQRLQIDATVLYALGVVKPNITSEDLAVESPYNTYRRSGLPPTPIAAARLASLQAAATPADTNFFYYVLTEANGGHTFTRDI